MQRREFFKYAGLGLAIGATPASAITTSIGELFPAPKEIYLDKKEQLLLDSSLKKINTVKKIVGYGNFNIIGFDEMISVAQKYSKVDEFTKAELDFMEKMFYANPSVHGFYGKKITQNITDRINEKEVMKIPNTGHYLFKGKAQDSYDLMCKDIGESLVLTSGIRSVVKQFSLYFGKIQSVQYNLNEASKSLAPPAYTYHSIGDFDVGKKGFGYANFTSRFALTSEFKKMRTLRYIDVRYTVNNRDGVRYEPWHVKII